MEWTKKERLDIEHIQEELLTSLLKNTNLRAADRDQALGRALAFDSFQEFYDDFKKWPLARFSHVDKLFASLIKIYFFQQLTPLATDQKWNEEIWRQVVEEAMKAKEEEFVQILKGKYPHICEEIEKKRNAHPNSPIF